MSRQKSLIWPAAAAGAGLLGWLIGCALHRPRDLLILAALVGGSIWSLSL